MDFIEGLPKSASKDVILVVVDRLTKYAHFLALSHLYSGITSLSFMGLQQQSALTEIGFSQANCGSMSSKQ
jgi:hypothetical protein